MLVLFLSSMKGYAYNSTYRVKVGDTFTVNTTYKNNTTAITWTFDYHSVAPSGYVGPASTSVTFEAIAPTSSSGCIIQSITYYQQNGYSMKQVDDWLVVVSPIKVSSISISPSSKSLYEGQYIDLTANVSPSNATNKEVKWSSGDSKVATVSNNGRVTAVKVGTTIIKCAAVDGSGKYGECRITVEEPIHVTNIDVYPTNIKLNVRDQYSLSYTVTPNNATYKNVWWRSSNSFVATVNGSGTVTAVGYGEADITCFSEENSNVSAKCHVVVNTVPVKSITLDQSSAILGLSEKKQLTATVLPTNATALTPKWESSNPEIAEVNDNGLVTAKSEGETTITCSAMDNSGVFATCTIEVQNIRPTSISLPSSVEIGVKESLPLTYTIQPSNAVTTLSWSSANENVATVSDDGVVKGIKVGSTVVTVRTAEGLTAECNITVNEVEFDHANKWTGMGNYSIDWYNKNEKVFDISTNRQLAGLAYLVNNGYDSFDGKIINITDDISLYGKNWISIGNSDDHVFKGTFNGNGHRIEDVTIGNQENGQKYVGFFGKVKGDVSFSDLTITGEIMVDNPIGGNEYLGGFIGFIDYPDNWCYIKNIDCQIPISFSRDLSLSENHPSITFGGLIGRGRRADISFCKYTGNIKIHQYPSSASFSYSVILGGGLIGNSENCCISYCEARCQDISAVCPKWNRNNSSASMGTIELGGLCGSVYSWNIKHCLAIANFTVTHHGWPFSNFGHPYVYIGHLIGKIEKETSLYNNIGIVSYIKQTNTANVNLRYFAFPDKLKEKEANYCNSDVDVAWGSYYKQSNYTSVTMYKQSEIKTQAFIDELNNYPMLTAGYPMWMLSEDDGYPQLKELHKTPDKKVTSIALSDTELSMIFGEENQLTVTILPEDATDKTVSWKTDNAAVATVSEDGLVTAVGQGTATITCRANDSSGVYATCEVTVKERASWAGKYLVSGQHEEGSSVTKVYPDNFGMTIEEKNGGTYITSMFGNDLTTWNEGGFKLEMNDDGTASVNLANDNVLDYVSDTGLLYAMYVWDDETGDWCDTWSLRLNEDGTISLGEFYVVAFTWDETDEIWEGGVEALYYDLLAVKDDGSAVHEIAQNQPGIHVHNGVIELDETTDVTVYKENGMIVYQGKTDRVDGLAKGMYIVCVGEQRKKVMVK